MLPAPYRQLQEELAAFLPTERLIVDPLRLLAWGTDASFYRLVPKLVVVVDDEDELRRVLAGCARLGTPVTFRAAGTSLSGQAITDSVLVMLGDGWRGSRSPPTRASITLQPGVIGAAANRRLAPLGRKIGPDPASIDAAMIGGIAANNASGMCCGTAQNSYHTLAGLRVVLADGTVLDTRDAASRAAFARAAARARRGPRRRSARATREDAALAARIRHKFRHEEHDRLQPERAGRLRRPVDILAHLMIGSEGTLGFISEITYRTVPEHADKASALILFDELETACSAVTRLKQHAGRRGRARSTARRCARWRTSRACPTGCARSPRTARRCWSRRARATPAALRARSTRSRRRSPAFAPFDAASASRPTPAECARSGTCARACSRRSARCARSGRPSSSRTSRSRSTRLAEATLDLQQLLRDARLPRGDHLRPRARRQPALRLHAGLQRRGRGRALPPLHGRAVPRWSSRSTTARSRPSTAPAATWRPFVELEWGAQALRADARDQARCSTRRACSIPA